MPRYRDHHLHLPHFHIDDSPDLRLLYAIRVIRDLVNKLTFFFLPLYLFNMGFDGKLLTMFPLEPFQRGMVLIGLYFVFHRMIVFFTAIPLGKLMRKIGLSFSLVVSHLIYVFVFLSLKMSVEFSILIFLAAIIDGFQVNFFWNTYNTLLSKFALQRHMGRDLGVLTFLLQLMAVASPAIGGIVIVLYGFEAVFLIALILNIIGIFLALFMSKKHSLSNPSYKQFFSWMKSNSFRKTSLSFVGRYINDAVMAVWPLYIFLLLGSIDQVGYLYSATLFVAMILSLFIGFYIDNHKSRKPFLLSGGVMSILWLLRSGAVAIWSIVAIDVVEKLTSNFHWLFYDSMFMKGGKGRKAFSYFIYREAILSLTAITFWMSFSLLFIFINSWTALFIIAAFGVMMSLLVKDNVKLDHK